MKDVKELVCPDLDLMNCAQVAATSGQIAESVYNIVIENVLVHIGGGQEDVHPRIYEEVYEAAFRETEDE